MKLYPVLILCFVIILTYSISYSQTRLSIQPGLFVPLGGFANTASLGFGGNATIEFLQSKKETINWSFTGMVGYNYFPTNKDLPEGEDYTYADIPIQAGLRYYTGKSDFKPYLGAELGFHLLTINYQGSGISDTYFGYAPILGVKLYYSRTVDVDINIKYNSISSEGSSLSYLGFNFGVQLALYK